MNREGLPIEQGRLAPPVDPERDHVRGPEDAPVTLVEYGDFGCPHCRDARETVRRLLQRRGSDVRFVFRHFPLENRHPGARLAAEAAEAAAAQGAFWDMHDHLFRQQGRLAREELVAAAEELGLDVDRFRRELDDEVHADRVEADFDSGVRSGVNGTPTFFVDGVRHDGGRGLEALLRAVDAASPGGRCERPEPAAGTGERSAAGSGSPTTRSDGMRGPRLGAAGGARPEASGGSAMRSVVDQARSGAPAAGRAVRDIFSTDEIFQRVVATADEEFSRSNRLLFLSGLAAGLSIALSFLARAAVTGTLSGESADLLGNALYPIGFLLILLGRYQLYTENTLTPVTLVLTRIASLPALLRVWGVVFAANVLGAAVAAYVFARTGIFDPDTAGAARRFAEHALSVPWWDLFWKGVIAGWLVASMVWLNHAARDTVSRVLIVFSIMFLIPAADLFHCIVGACEVLYLVFLGDATMSAFAWDFLAPVTAGNTVGGVVLVAILNFSQTRNRRIADRDCSALELPWRDWCLAMRTGRPDELRPRDDRG